MTYPEAVETARLTLRRSRPDDAGAYAAIWEDADVWRALRAGEEGDPREVAAESHAKQLRHWEEHGFGLWAVVPRGEAEPVGWIGAWYPDFVPDLAGQIEVGWTLRRPFWGRGLATEGARAALDATFVHLAPDSPAGSPRWSRRPASEATCGSRSRSSSAASSTSGCAPRPPAGAPSASRPRRPERLRRS